MCLSGGERERNSGEQGRSLVLGNILYIKANMVFVCLINK